MVEATYDQKIIEAIETVEETPQVSDRIALSTGVVLKLKQVNVLRIQAIMDQFEYPQVPMVPNPDKGRDERNPNDPFYQAEIAKIDTQRSMAVLDAIATMGTEPLTIPENVPGIEDEGWVEECQLFNIPVGTTELGRYLSWVKYVAIKDTDDLMKIGQQFGQTLGISEARVAEQLRSNFPDN